MKPRLRAVFCEVPFSGFRAKMWECFCPEISAFGISPSDAYRSWRWTKRFVEKFGADES